MKDYLKKLEEIYKKLNIRKVSYEPSGIEPFRDWVIILLSFVGLVFFIAVSAFYFYTKVDKGELFRVDGAGEENEVKINMTLLKKVVGDISSREQNTIIIRQSNENLSDPSF